MIYMISYLNRLQPCPTITFPNNTMCPEVAQWKSGNSNFWLLVTLCMCSLMDKKVKLNVLVKD